MGLGIYLLSPRVKIQMYYTSPWKGLVGSTPSHQDSTLNLLRKKFLDWADIYMSASSDLTKEALA
jgi:hypothetical protein